MISNGILFGVGLTIGYVAAVGGFALVNALAAWLFERYERWRWRR